MKSVGREQGEPKSSSLTCECSKFDTTARGSQRGEKRRKWGGGSVAHTTVAEDPFSLLDIHIELIGERSTVTVSSEHVEKQQ